MPADEIFDNPDMNELLLNMDLYEFEESRENEYNNSKDNEEILK